MISLIMLVMMTLLALTSFNLGRGEHQIISNMQFQSEAASSAQMAIEQVLSNLNFSANPANVFASPCTTANTICYDTNGDANPNVQVAIKSRTDAAKPVCIKANILKNAALDLSKPDDLGCAAGASQSFGVAGASAGDSLCAESTWDVQADAVDAVTQARATITQGIAVRVPTDSIVTSCPI